MNLNLISILSTQYSVLKNLLHTLKKGNFVA